MTDAQKQADYMEKNHRDNTPTDVPAPQATVTLRGPAALAYARELGGSLCYGPNSADGPLPEITVRTDHPNHLDIMAKIFPPQPDRMHATFSPSPWSEYNDDTIQSPLGNVIARTFGDDDCDGTGCPATEGAIANCRRIVACVNACAGLATAELHLGAVQLVSRKFMSEAGSTNARQKDTICALVNALDRIANGVFAAADQAQSEQHLRAVAAAALRATRPSDSRFPLPED